MTRRKILMLAGTVGLSATRACVAQAPTAAPEAAAAAPRYPASETPDRVILTWDGDPGRTQAVSWRTDGSAKAAVAQIARETGAPSFANAPLTVEAASSPLTVDGVSAVYHRATFRGLAPSTLYGYRVGDGENWSEWTQFRTAAETPEPLSFIYLGDAQNGIRSMWSRTVRRAFATAPDARFLLHAGDLTEHGVSDDEWGEWCEAGSWVLGSTPSVPAAGNHDYKGNPHGDNSAERITPYWTSLFGLPRNGPAGFEETTYYVDIQGVRVIVLSSQNGQQEQTAWLEGLLADNPCRWTVVTFHHPVYSSAHNRDNRAVRESWRPLFERYRVDLVLQGHDHVYGRANTEANGPTPMYLVSVSGPKMYALDDRSWAQRAGANLQMFQVVRVNGDKLTFEAYTDAGDLYDAFELIKGAGGACTLADLPAATSPERTGALDGPEF